MSLIGISIRRRVTTAMFTIAVVLFGFVSFFRLKVNLLPNLSYPSLTIRTEFVGAAPAEIENLITKPIEEALGVVKNVQQVRSISRSGQSDVLLEFAWGTDMDFAGLDVREKLDVLQLPLDVKRPYILRFDPSLDPIIRFGLYSAKKEAEQKNKGESYAAMTALENEVQSDFDEENLKYLRRFADEEIKKELESAIGVAAVKISGGLEDEIQVLIDQARLSQLNLSVNQIASQLEAENVNLSGGRLEEGTQQFLVRTLNQFKSVKEIGDVIIDNQKDVRVHLRDIADVHHGYKEREAIIRMNGVEAVEVAIYKEGDANTVSVARAVEKRLKRVEDLLPEGVKLVKLYDQSIFITQAVNEVIQAGLIGGLLAIIILYFFLNNFWSTAIISMSIPVSVIATFNLMYGADLTLNIMSLGGIALGIGMLLDNSIVVLENIARHRELGKDTVAAARDGAGEVSKAVTASTLTTVAVFFPLVFVKGIAGQLFRDQALTVTFSLLASLVVALTLIPMLSSLGNRKQGRTPTSGKDDAAPAGRVKRSRIFLFTILPSLILKAVIFVVRLVSRIVRIAIRPLSIFFNKVYGSIEDAYPVVLKWSLHKRALVLCFAFSVFLFTIAMIPLLGIELIPQLFQGQFRVEFRLPPGTPLERTDATLASIQNSSESISNLKATFSVAGTGNRMDANPEEGGEYWGELSVVMVEGSTREDEERAIESIREGLRHMPGLQYKFSRPNLFTFKTPIEVEVLGYDLKKLQSVSQEIAGRLESSGRFADVKSSMREGHPEIQIHFDRERAAAMGLAVHEIAERVVRKVRGEVASKFTWHDRKIDILVRAREADRESVDRIRKLIVNPNGERPVPLMAVANVTVENGPGEIQRVGQERVAIVSSNLNFGALGEAASEIETILQQIAVPGDLSVRIAGQNEEMSTSFRSMIFALLLAVFLVYLVMASQFESFLHPLVIFFTIPLSLIGAILALLFTGSTVSVVVFIGLILLAGIVVNNAIVLIDLINQLRGKGQAKMAAIIEAGRARLRPIMMTTVTTTLGLFPLAMGFGEGAEVRAPMAITVIGGLIVSTLLSLVVIPVMYSIMDRGE